METLGERERRKWFSIGLDGMVVDLRGLKELFPYVDEENPEIRAVEQTERYLFYGRFNIELYACWCRNCDKIIVGPPLIKDELSVDDEGFKEEYIISCRKCNYEFKKFGSG